MEATIQRAKQGARRYLELKGYETLEGGWCHGKDSVDLIVADEDDALVFIGCEVSDNAGEGILENVGPNMSLCKAARFVRTIAAGSWIADRFVRADNCKAPFHVEHEFAIISNYVYGMALAGPDFAFEVCRNPGL